MPAGAEADIIKGMYLFRQARSAEAEGAARAVAGLRHDLPRSHRRRRTARDRTGASRPICGAARASPNWPATDRRSRAGTCCIRPRSRGCRMSRDASRPREGRWLPPPTTCALFAEQIRAFVPRRYLVLGTDGFGRSDTREKLRHFFEVDRYWVTVAALKALADEGARSRRGEGRQTAIAKVRLRSPKRSRQRRGRCNAGPRPNDA